MYNTAPRFIVEGIVNAERCSKDRENKISKFFQIKKFFVFLLLHYKQGTNLYSIIKILLILKFKKKNAVKSLENVFIMKIFIPRGSQPRHWQARLFLQLAQFSAHRFL
jgi:hypothetical protein